VDSLGKSVFGLVSLFLVVYLLPLNVRELSAPDEMRYGEIAREMLATGNFIAPRLDGLRYFEKPAGGYVLNAAAMALFGETNFAVRLMSALSTGLSALGVGWLVHRYFNTQTAVLAAFIFLTCCEVLGVGTFSVLDSMLSCCLTLSLCCFYAALTTTKKQRLGFLAASGVFAGGAFLVKGFVALVVVVIVIVPFLALRRQWKDLFTLSWLPLLTAFLVALPWSVAVAIKEPDYWNYFFWEEHIRRFVSSERTQHRFPFWFFVPIFIGGTMPWSFLGPMPIRDMFRSRRQDPLLQFSLAWMVGPFLFFSASSGKLGTYILPCFAPFAVLLAAALNDRLNRDTPDRAIRIAIYIFTAFVIAGLLTTLVVFSLTLTHYLSPLDVHYVAKSIGWVVGLSIAAGLLIRACRRHDEWQKIILLGLASCVLFITGTICLPTEISASIGIQGLLQSERHRIQPDTILISSPREMLSASYVYQRSDVYLFRDSGELAYGLSYPEAKHRYLEVSDVVSILKDRGDQSAVIVVNSPPGDEIRQQLPEPSYQRQWLNVWFAFYDPLTSQDPRALKDQRDEN